ncbi:MAG: biopolymer transporter ExbD, partial [Calditrichaeota bacterium]
MRHRPRKRSYEAMSSINIANLVDVVLVLLIIFMISAPLLQSGIEVDLPSTKAAAVNEQAEGIVITLDSKKGIYINDVWARLENFETELQKAMDDKGTSSVYLRA